MSSLAGVGTLAGAIVHRDKFRSLTAVGALVGLVYASAVNIESLYPTRSDLLEYAELIDGNAMMVVQSGPGYGLDDPSVGAVLVNEVGIWTFIAVALVNVFAITRNTLAEEESGRLELIRSSPVGHRAPLVAAMLVTTGINLVLGAGVAAVVIASGLPVVGSIAFGAALAGCGMFFTGVTLLAAQVTSHARGAVAIGAATLAVAFITRAVGDVGSGGLSWLSWLSPIGWGHRLRPFADERWWPLLLSITGAAALAGAGMQVAARRDFGAGIIAPRRGPAAASPALSGPAGLVWRTQRASILGWAVGLAVVGVFYGVVADEAEQMVADNPELEEFFVQAGGASVTEGFLSTALLMIALIVAAFGVSSTLRMRASEQAGHAEPLLAAPISRWRWAGSHLLLTAVAVVALLGIGGAATGAGYVLVGADSGEIPQLAGAAIAHTPATLVLAAATVLLFGVLPRATVAAWAIVAVVVVITLLGQPLGLPATVRRLSPLEHSPLLPADDLAITPLAVLAAVVVLVAGSGLAAFRHRDAT